MVAQGADVLKPSVEMLLQWGGNAASEVQRGQNSLVLEALAMASVLAPGSTHPEPVDPQRMAVLEAEMQKSTERMAAMATQMQRKP